VIDDLADHVRRLAPLPPPAVEGRWSRLRRWWTGAPPPHPGNVFLLLPEGASHEIPPEEIARLGINAIVTPHERRSRLHRSAARAGLDTSRPILVRAH
jgi:hypothetical protein